MGNFAVIITGAGSSLRYGSKNKLLENLCGVPVFIRSIKNLSGFAEKENFILTVNQNDKARFEDELKKHNLDNSVTVVAGGSSRIESVRNALNAVKLEQGKIAIHDAARPLAEKELLQKLFSDPRNNVIAAQKVVDSIKLCDENGKIIQEIERTFLWRAETPQVFDIVQYRQAMLTAPTDATDDASIMRHAGFNVFVVKEDKENLKLTTPEDLQKLEKFCKE